VTMRLPVTRRPAAHVTRTRDAAARCRRDCVRRPVRSGI
jgi:hypothetical protein